METWSMEFRGDTHDVRYPWSKLLRGRRSKRDICESAFSRSVSDVPRLRSKHKSHRWSNNSPANRSYDEGTEAWRSYKSELCLHPTGFNNFFSTYCFANRVQHDTQLWFFSPQGTLKRRQHLNEAKFFWCICERCKSPDELSTQASTLLCPKCEHGFVLSTNPLNESADWRWLFYPVQIYVAFESDKVSNGFWMQMNVVTMPQGKSDYAKRLHKSIELQANES